MVKTYYSWQDVNTAATNIALKMYKDGWKPDYIVGLNRGGLPISVMLSHLLNCNHYALDVRLRDNATQESNCWMAEDAFGYHDGQCKPKMRKQILIVDDINDTGATFNWIMKDWQSGCLPNSEGWNDVWNDNVRFATLTDNLASEFTEHCAYTCHEINKADEDVWLVYPWENVGTYG